LDGAIFRIRKIDFALSQAAPHDVKVWVSQDQIDADAALDILLEALGIGREALTYRGDPETGYVDLRTDPEA
jgi:hypothetical protein